MKGQYTAVLKKKGDWWIGWIEEVPGVNCQERSKEDLIESLRITLREALEFNRREALDRQGKAKRRKKSPYEAPRVASASPSLWIEVYPIVQMLLANSKVAILGSTLFWR